MILNEYSFSKRKVARPASPRGGPPPPERAASEVAPAAGATSEAESLSGIVQFLADSAGS